MDTALNRNGDFDVDGSGRPLILSGRRELLQQIYIRLSAGKGAFLYDRELGSEIAAAGDDSDLLEAKVRAALEGVPETEVTGIRQENGILAVTVEVNGGEETILVRRGEQE